MSESEVYGKSECNKICKSLHKRAAKVREQFLAQRAKLEMELKEIEMKIKEEKDKIQELRECQKEEEMKQRQEDEERDALKLEMKCLMESNKKLENEIQELNSRIEALRNFKPSAKDEAYIQLCRDKFQLYKDITGVRWDYKANGTQGCVINKATYYMKPFSLESPSDDKVWEEIAKASSADWSEFLCE